MGELFAHSIIRYPPFDSSRWNPEEIPPAEEKKSIGFFETKEKAMEALLEKMPSFIIGSRNGWFVEQKYTYDHEPLFIQSSSEFIDEKKFPKVVKQQRRGWYLHPHPIHRLVRKLIKVSVIILLICLLYLFIEPILSSFGIPSVGTQTIRFGLLDYPLLSFIVVPLLFAPIFLRVYGNVSDLRAQKKFLNMDIKTPIIHFLSTTTPDTPLKIKIEFPFMMDDWNDIFVKWQVGVLSPSREALLSAHNRTSSMQPPPGLSTELPHHWENSLDDGTAGGEDAPMETREASGGLFLRPMRIMDHGHEVKWHQDDEITLQPPPMVWPGTVCSELLRIHWECVITIHRDKLAPLFYVQPLKVHFPNDQIEVNGFKINDGRIELVENESTT